MFLTKVFLGIALWICYAITDGITDGFTFHKSKLANNFDNKVFKKDIHGIFTIKRAILASVVTLWFINDFDDIKKLVLFSNMYLITLGLMYPLFHNGFYYITRKHLDPKQTFTGFSTDDFSKDSTARINVGLFFIRKMLFYISIAVLIACLLIVK